MLPPHGGPCYLGWASSRAENGKAASQGPELSLRGHEQMCKVIPSSEPMWPSHEPIL